MNVTEEMVIALYDYQAKDEEELTIRKNEQLTLLDNSGQWYKVRNKTLHVGFVPSNYVKLEKSKGESLVNRIANRFPGTRKGKATTAGSNSEGDGTTKKLSVSAAEKTMSESYVAKYTYDSARSDELSLIKGMNIIVLAKLEDGWWQGRNADGQIGWFPSNYVEEESRDDNCAVGNSQNNRISNTVNPPKQVLEVVRALYSFNSGNPEELPFEREDMFDIIGKPESDPEWYEARNSEGQTGLVPINYIEVVPGAPSVYLPETSSYDDVTNETSQNGSTQSHQVSATGDGPSNLSNKAWYYGPVGRTEAETMLYQKAKNSEFMIRASESTVGDLSVSMKAPDRIKHFKVSFRNGKYCIGQRKFDSVESLIDHYRRAPIYTAPDIGKIYLGQPMPR